jgi:hypothetical protein
MSNFKVKDADKEKLGSLSSHQRTDRDFLLDNDASLTKEINKQLNELG